MFSGYFSFLLVLEDFADCYLSEVFYTLAIQEVDKARVKVSFSPFSIILQYV